LSQNLKLNKFNQIFVLSIIINLFQYTYFILGGYVNYNYYYYNYNYLCNYSFCFFFIKEKASANYVNLYTYIINIESCTLFKKIIVICNKYQHLTQALFFNEL